MFKQYLTSPCFCKTNVDATGMSWAVRHSEVATLTFLRNSALQLQSDGAQALSCLRISVPDTYQRLLWSLICLLISLKYVSFQEWHPSFVYCCTWKKAHKQAQRNTFRSIEDVGMTVPKPRKLGRGMAVYRQDRLHTDYTSNPIPASFSLHNAYLVACRRILCKERGWDGVTSCLYTHPYAYM